MSELGKAFAELDAAKQAGWRMPTPDEWAEVDKRLKAECMASAGPETAFGFPCPPVCPGCGCGSWAICKNGRKAR